MAEAERLIFDEAERSNVNLAIEQITARITDFAVDSRGNRIWQSVKRGIGLPGGFVQEYEAPAILIYDSPDNNLVQATTLVDQEILTNVDLYCFLYVLGSKDGSWADVQPLRRNMTRATLRSLWPSSVGHVGLDPKGWEWRFDPQGIIVDYGNVLGKVYPGYEVEPPWWVWKISLTVWSWNVY